MSVGPCAFGIPRLTRRFRCLRSLVEGLLIKKFVPHLAPEWFHRGAVVSDSLSVYGVEEGVVCGFRTIWCACILQSEFGVREEIE